MKVGSGALFLCSSTRRVLLNLRSPNKTHRLTWSLWGGMCEGDETPTETLKREVSEEVGFEPPASKIYPFDIWESRDKNFRFYTFVWVVPEEFTPELNSESVGYAWTNVGIWPKPLHEGVRNTFASKKGSSLLEIVLDQHC